MSTLVFFTSPLRLSSVFSSQEYARSAFWFSAAACFAAASFCGRSWPAAQPTPAGAIDRLSTTIVNIGSGHRCSFAHRTATLVMTSTCSGTARVNEAADCAAITAAWFEPAAAATPPAPPPTAAPIAAPSPPPAIAPMVAPSATPPTTFLPPVAAVP